MKNLYELLQLSATLEPDAVYIDAPGEKETDPRRDITFSQMLKECQRWAGVLQSFGVGEGDRVAFVSTKSLEQIKLFFACWQLGAIAVPVSEGLGDFETSFILSDCDPRLIISHPAFSERISQLSERQLLTFSQLTARAGLPLNEIHFPDEDKHTAVLIYTSGSTGKPKGVMLSHRNLLVNGISSGDLLPLSHADRVVSILPYWHSFALTAELVMLLQVRGTIVLARDRRDFSRGLASWKPTVVMAVPRMLSMFKEQILAGMERQGEQAALALGKALDLADALFAECGTPSPEPEMRRQRLQQQKLLLEKIRAFFGGQLRFFISGGAPIAPELQQFFRNVDLPVYQGYGLTEASPVISCNIPGFSRIGSSGLFVSWLKPEFGGDWTFLDEEGRRGKDLEGELLVKGCCVMQGYWRHTDASAKSLDKEGWLHTGDLGYSREGYLYLRGRASNLLCLRGGEKVHPEPVEDALKEVDGVAECLIIGEGCKNVYALLNLDEDAPALEQLKPQLQEAVSGFGPHQKPKNFLILKQFTPDDGTLTPTLKVRRKQVWQRDEAKIKKFLTSCNESINSTASDQV